MKLRLITSKRTALADSLRATARELRTRREHRRGLAKARAFRNPHGLRLNLGCGSKLKNGWLNIDSRRGADLTLDLRRALPFPDNSCSIVYSEHFLEHLDYPEPALSLLHQCYRILESGGLLSIGVPDTEWPLLEYSHVRDEGYFRLAKQRWHPRWCETRMEHINYHFRQNNDHHFAYDYETLRRALSIARFSKIRRRTFDPNLDSEDRRLGTLYVDARKVS